MDIEQYDKGSERAVLSGVINGGLETFFDVDDIININTFFIDSNQAIFKCIKHALENGAEKLDAPTILSSAKSIGLGDFFESEQEIKHLRSIINMSVDKSNIRKLAAKIRKLQITRDYIGQLEQSIEELRCLTGDEPIDKILSIPENKILEFSNLLTKDKSDGPESLGIDIDMWVEHLIANPIENIGLPTPFEEWNKAVGGGLRKGTVNVFGARPKTGKTSLGITFANHFASLKIPCLYLDTEMSKEDHRMRTLAMLSGVWANDIETGKFAANKAKKSKVYEAADKMKESSYDILTIAGQPFEETISIMRRWITQKVKLNGQGKANDCVIVFDYLKLMEATSISKHMQEYQALGFMMTALHNFAVKYQVPIVLFIQLNRDGVDVENSTAASGSDRIIWLCSNFTIYKKLSDSEMAAQAGSKNKYNRKAIITDCRHGPGLDRDTFIALKADMNCFQITEIGIKSNDESNQSTEEIQFS